MVKPLVSRSITIPAYSENDVTRDETSIKYSPQIQPVGLSRRDMNEYIQKKVASGVLPRETRLPLAIEEFTIFLEAVNGHFHSWAPDEMQGEYMQQLKQVKRAFLDETLVTPKGWEDGKVDGRKYPRELWRTTMSGSREPVDTIMVPYAVVSEPVEVVNRNYGIPKSVSNGSTRIFAYHFRFDHRLPEVALSFGLGYGGTVELFADMPPGSKFREGLPSETGFRPVVGSIAAIRKNS